MDGDGIIDPIAGCANEPWGWTNGNGGGNGNGNAGGNGNGNGPCGNNGNGNSGGGSGPEVFEANQYFYHPDHLGSSSYVTDVDGEIFQHLEYFPFGETWVEESSNTQRTPYLFTSKELDEQTGLYYFGARYYDPRTSVWQSPDPILASYMAGERSGEGVFTPMNLNLYGYSHNKPILLVDPDGREPAFGPNSSGSRGFVYEFQMNYYANTGRLPPDDGPFVQGLFSYPRAIARALDGYAANEAGDTAISEFLDLYSSNDAFFDEANAFAAEYLADNKERVAGRATASVTTSILLRRGGGAAGQNRGGERGGANGRRAGTGLGLLMTGITVRADIGYFAERAHELGIELGPEQLIEIALTGRLDSMQQLIDPVRPIVE